LNKSSLPLPASNRSLAAILLGCGACLALTLYFLLPPRGPMTWALDSSNYGSYAWMFATGRQFGADTLAMTGPFGFLAYGHTYSGFLFREYFLGDFLFKAAFSLLVFSLLRRLPAGIWRWLWLMMLLVFLPSVDDLLYDIAVLVAGATLLLQKETERLSVAGVVAAVLLGFSVLMKGSHASLAGASLGFVVVAEVWRGNRLRTAIITVLAFATFLGGWLLAGQHLGNLPGYFRGLAALTSGYNAAMGLDPAPAVLVFGLILSGLFSVVLLLHGFGSPRDRQRILLVVFFALCGFVQWKHGFVRADGHVYMFFGFVAVMVPLLQMTMWIVDPPAAEQRRILAAAVVAAFLCLAVGTELSEFSAKRFGELLVGVPQRFESNIRYFVSPRQMKQQREQELQQVKQRSALSDIRRDVGPSSIDFFGYEEGILLLNELNYRPRPMAGGSFNVYHPYLQEMNARFMHDATRRPDFFLLKLKTIDQRLPAVDDPLTLQALLSFYRPVRAQRDYVLFEKNAAPETAPPRLLKQEAVKLGEWLPVPNVGANELLLFSLDVGASLGGALRGVVYHPPLFTIEIAAEDELAPHTFQLSPLSARVPVLLSPLLATTSDVVSLYDKNSTGGKVQRIRFVAPHGGFASSGSISFYTMARPREGAGELASEIVTYLQHPLSNREPLSLSTQETGIKELFEEPITLVHAPGSIVFPVAAGDQQLIFNFGIMPQAYDPGETDGVEFIVEYLRENQPPQLLFSRLLQPRTVAKDRGMQWARVFFPPQISAGSVRVRTERGPAGNGAYDQSYVAHVQIKAGPFDPRQLTGFSVAPEPPGFPDPNPALFEGREVRMVLPPGQLTFAIPSASRFATITVGILPAAYEGENHSDGIGCEVAIVLPDGREERLAQHVLDPVHDRQARGSVTWDLPLPEFPVGSRLLLRFNGGPKDDLRWDWSYVQTVRFR
jgi:hypothetical protein